MQDIGATDKRPQPLKTIEPAWSTMLSGLIRHACAKSVQYMARTKCCMHDTFWVAGCTRRVHDIENVIIRYIRVWGLIIGTHQLQIPVTKRNRDVRHHRPAQHRLARSAVTHAEYRRI
jgi:hypothetical protein